MRMRGWLSLLLAILALFCADAVMAQRAENPSRQIRKMTKNKGVFPNDTALVKLVYLAYRNARKKWTMPVPNWGIISQQLAIKFDDRYNLL